MRNEVSEISSYTPVQSSGISQNLVSRDRNYNELLTLAETVAKSKATVLILGEFGAGKRTLAKYIHENSTRAGKPLLSINCREVAVGDQETVFDALVKQAQGATLMLAEIWKLASHVQLKLFQILQENHDIRVIATSSRSLANLVKNAEFREDLYYRLNVVNLKIPNLQDRLGDVEFLATRFVQKWGSVHGREGMKLSEDAVLFLNSHRWPGNIRELDGACERAVLLAPDSLVRARDIQIQQPAERPSAEVQMATWKPGRTLDEIERNVILEALKHYTGNRTHTAKALGISIRTLRNKLAEYRVMGIKA